MIFSLRVCCTQFCTLQQATGPQDVACRTCEAADGAWISLGSAVVEVAEAHPNPEEGVHCRMPIELGIKALNVLNPDALVRTHFDHLAEGLVDGTVVDALLPAFEKKVQHLIWSGVACCHHALSGEDLRALEVNESMRFHLSAQSRCFRAGLLVCLNPVSYKTNSPRFQVGETELDTEFQFRNASHCCALRFTFQVCLEDAKPATLHIVALSGFAFQVCLEDAKPATLRIVALSGFAIHVCFGRREPRNTPRTRKRETRNAPQTRKRETRNAPHCCASQFASRAC